MLRPHSPSLLSATRRDFLRAAAGLPLLGAPLGRGRLVAASSGRLRLVAVGQALIEHDLRRQPYAGYGPLVEHLAGADVCFTNLEVAIDAPGAGRPTKSGVYFHAAEPAALDCLRSMSFNLLALSNNHAWDLGAEGLRTTIREVSARGFRHAGSGRNLDEASAPTVLETPRGSVALVAMASKVNPASIATAEGPGVNHLAVDAAGQVDRADAARNLRAIERAAAMADLVLVYQHNHYWSADWQQTPAWQQRWARQCIDAGAALFVNHGVPLLHGIEIYRGRPIFYGLGNFVFHTHTPPGHYTDEVWQSVVADMRFAGRGLSALALHPLRLTEGIPGESYLATRGRPELAAGDQATAILQRIEQLSAPYGTRLTLGDGRAAVALDAAAVDSPAR